MRSIHIRYGLNNPVKIYTTEKELKKAFKSEEEFEKYIDKIKKEIHRDERTGLETGK